MKITHLNIPNLSTNISNKNVVAHEVNIGDVYFSHGDPDYWIIVGKIKPIKHYYCAGNLIMLGVKNNEIISSQYGQESSFAKRDIIGYCKNFNDINLDIEFKINHE